ncbi:MAG: CDP-glycerol glycerophosphotransferase family protein, partial [Burkholderiales bacterium]|nr:CDP-glycerol glycerophosphotransferase family protein [Burkholderiales bacterium]
GQHGKRIVFMPHPNAVPFIDAFAPPAHVEVCTKAETSFLPLLSRSVAMITDYTSVAFDMALLRRCVFYYQFDREEFYGGSHNWREGYFDDDRDGFGPVATDEAALVANIAAFLARGSQPEPEYVRRMEATLPETDGHCCERVFAAICETARPYRHRMPA